MTETDAQGGSTTRRVTPEGSSRQARVSAVPLAGSERNTGRAADGATRDNRAEGKADTAAQDDNLTCKTPQSLQNIDLMYLCIYVFI